MGPRRPADMMCPVELIEVGFPIAARLQATEPSQVEPRDSVRLAHEAVTDERRCETPKGVHGLSFADPVDDHDGDDRTLPVGGRTGVFHRPCLHAPPGQKKGSRQAKPSRVLPRLHQARMRRMAPFEEQFFENKPRLISNR